MKETGTVVINSKQAMTSHWGKQLTGLVKLEETSWSHSALATS